MMKKNRFKHEYLRRLLTLFAAAGVIGITPVRAEKQRLIVILQDPLRPEASEVTLPAVTNARGETRDLKAALQLADSTTIAPERDTHDTAQWVLGMTAKPLDPHTLWLRITLPQPAEVEVLLMDLYGKNLGTLFSGQCPQGELILKPEFPKSSDPRGLKVVALRVNGNIVTRQVIAPAK